MAKPTRDVADKMALRFLNNEITIDDLASYWRCGRPRAYQLVNQVAQKATGNYRCRDGRLISFMTAKKEMFYRRFGHFSDDTPEAFYERGEINQRA